MANPENPQPQKDVNQVYYEDFFQRKEPNSVMSRIWREAFGDQFPEGLDHFGYVTGEEMEIMQDWMNLPEGSEVLDMGCGKGGPGLRIAENLGLKLTGVDIVEGAVAQAREFQKSFSLKYPANFLVGDFYKIPLEEQTMDGVISIDALWTAHNKIKALKRVKRVMKPGTQFIFSHWDQKVVDPVIQFEQSGLKFVKRVDRPGWIDFQRKIYDAILANQEELVAEMGRASNMLIYEAKTSPQYLDQSIRRIYCFEFEG